MLKATIAIFSAAVLTSCFFAPIALVESESPKSNVNIAKSSMPRAVQKIGYPSLMSPHASPIAIQGKHVFVVNTPADTVDVIDRFSRKIITRIDVGIDPVSIAVRPDGKEVWVSNHVSDSVSVIDNDPANPTYQCVIATVQDFDRNTKSTRFDEPVGIAFANNEKAYVALSSENKIAVVDVKKRKVTNHLTISAQDPRAVTVRNGRLYVIPFESNNKTQLSGGTGELDGELTTFDAHEHSIANNNVLSLGHVVDIIKHPKVPDRDLFVFDTETDKLIQTVDTLGTLLYGMTVDSKGNVFVAQADARNDVNGRSGTKKHGLQQLENRAFLNRITQVNFKDGEPTAHNFIELEPLPPSHPKPGEAFATPFAIEVSQDDKTLFVSAAGSDKFFTVDVESGEVIGQVPVDSVPRGIAIDETNPEQTQVWVLNAVANTVSLVDVTDPAKMKVFQPIELEDPTHATFKRGRIAFNTASASTTGTFSCASCHPDGHTDQLLWVLKTPIVSGGDQIMPRSTMPLRGLRDTAPFHWDGVPGDPYGGINSASIHRSIEPNSQISEPESATRHVIDGGLASTMAMVGNETINDEGKPGLLSAKERDDMAKFLLNVTFPPAQRRAFDNKLSKRAKEGFELFHIKGDLDGKPRPNVCGDCHRMPFLVSTNTPGTGMDAPTWRGAYDRWLILPQGRLNIIDFDFYKRVAERGAPERNIWQFSWAGRRRFDPVWNMVLEGSTGYSGSFARQVTLNQDTVEQSLTSEMLDALETSAREGGVILQAEGVFINEVLRGGAKFESEQTTLQFDPSFDRGAYVRIDQDRDAFSRKELFEMTKEGTFVGTVTARHGEFADLNHPQPAIWTLGQIEAQRGRQKFPILFGDQKSMIISGRHLGENVHVIIDGRRVPADVVVDHLSKNERVEIELKQLPDVGIHFLQLQNLNGLFSNDFIFHVVEKENDAKRLRMQLDPNASSDAFAKAISNGNMKRVAEFIKKGVGVNVRNARNGMTPLSTAAFHGRLEIAKRLIANGARISGSNRDGNTPLHLAAFLCRTELVEMLLEKGASIEKKNKRGENSIEVVSAEWDDGLGDFYQSIIDSSRLKIEIESLEADREKMRLLLIEAKEKRDQRKQKDGK